MQQRRGLVGGLPAERRRARQLRGGVLRGSRRDRPPRRDASRRRSRSPSRPRTTPRCAASRSRTSARRTREIELTSYAEIVLAPPAADAAHPAFSKLFVQTEFVADVGALLATRRPRSPGEPRGLGGAPRRRRGRDAWATCSSRPTARASSGAGATIRTPISVIDGRPLSNTVGTVLDPIFSLRRRVRIPPGATARVAFWTLVAPSRERGARPGRQAPRPDGLRARGHAGVDPGAGPAPSSRHRPRRGAPLPASRQPRALLRPDAAAVLRRARAQRGGPADALGARDLRRPADRAGPDRRGRGPRDRPAAAARPRVLADEAARRRSRDPERTAAVLRAGSPGRRSRRWCARASRGRTREGEGARGAACSSCAPTWCRSRCATVLQSAARAVAAEPPREPLRAGASGSRRRRPPPRRRGAARRPRAPRRRRAAAAGARVLQRPRRLRRRRARVRDDPRRGAVDAGAVDQRDRQPVRSASRSRSRAAATRGRATAARTSSRRGRTIPSATGRAR